MIAESAILVMCVYGLMREDHLLKIAAITSLLAFPAIMLFAKAGSGTIVLLLLALEAVPFAFSILLMHSSGEKRYRRLWK
ncbi:MAG: hypothetical protein GOU99_01310 [Candidatus Altiarchaeota archaeon]|nr:hypothetical protein [Candidatus Altiarchaeota archaeon]